MTGFSQQVSDWVYRQIEHAGKPILLMISGAQGIGKSSAMAALEFEHSHKVVVLGIDDFYLTKSERAILAKDIHPLCETRGPPGTHDISLLLDTLHSLLNASESTKTALPKFDKRSDDRFREDEWKSYEGMPDAIVLEGWLLGVIPDEQSPMRSAINALEAEEDTLGIWRDWQEKCLMTDYLPLWKMSNGFLHLLAPNFDAVLDWRLEQEETTLGIESGTLNTIRRDWVFNFIQHFERITRRMLQGHYYPGSVIRVDFSRNVVSDESCRPNVY